MIPEANLVPFTSADYADRMARVVADAQAAGLDGLLVTPGPDLVWLTGYQPTAITERLTMLVLTPDAPPTLLVPILERADAEAAVGAPGMQISDWTDGADPYERVGRLLRQDGSFGISESAWAMHLLGLQDHAPETRYHSVSDALPMMRAVKDAAELERLALAEIGRAHV